LFQQLYWRHLLNTTHYLQPHKYLFSQIIPIILSTQFLPNFKVNGSPEKLVNPKNVSSSNDFIFSIAFKVFNWTTLAKLFATPYLAAFSKYSSYISHQKANKYSQYTTFIHLAALISCGSIFISKVSGFNKHVKYMSGWLYLYTSFSLNDNIEWNFAFIPVSSNTLRHYDFLKNSIQILLFQQLEKYILLDQPTHQEASKNRNLIWQLFSNSLLYKLPKIRTLSWITRISSVSSLNTTPSFTYYFSIPSITINTSNTNKMRRIMRKFTHFIFRKPLS